MKKIDWKILIITALLCLAPMAIGLAYYDVLPESVAIHFDINNNPDNFWPKDAFVFGMPLLMFAIQIFTSLVVDLTDKRKDANKKVTLIAKLMVPIITIILYGVTISYALGNMLDIRKIVMWIVGVMFIVIGNYMPKTKGNSFIKGINIEDEKLQTKVNKIVGYMYIINGLLSIGSVFLKPIFSVMVILVLIIEMLVLQIWICRKLKEKGMVGMKEKMSVFFIFGVLILIGTLFFITLQNDTNNGEINTKIENISYKVLSDGEYTQLLEIERRRTPGYEIIEKDNEYYLIIYHGEEPTYFKKLEVTNVTVDGKDIEVSVKLYGVGDGDAFSYPVAVLKLDTEPEKIKIIREAGYIPEEIVLDSIQK